MVPRGKSQVATNTTDAKLQQNLPHGVFVCEFTIKRTNFYCNMGLVTGYLKDCLDTGKLCDIMTSLDPLFTQYTIIHSQNWSNDALSTNTICISQTPRRHQICNTCTRHIQHTVVLAIAGGADCLTAVGANVRAGGVGARAAVYISTVWCGTVTEALRIATNVRGEVCSEGVLKRYGREMVLKFT